MKPGHVCAWAICVGLLPVGLRTPAGTAPAVLGGKEQYAAADESRRRPTMELEGSLGSWVIGSVADGLVRDGAIDAAHAELASTIEHSESTLDRCAAILELGRLGGRQALRQAQGKGAPSFVRRPADFGGRAPRRARGKGAGVRARARVGVRERARVREGSPPGMWGSGAGTTESVARRHTR